MGQASQPVQLVGSAPGAPRGKAPAAQPRASQSAAAVPSTSSQMPRATKMEKALSSAAYPAALYDYLKRHGRRTISSLGEKVPRASYPGVPRLAVVLRENPQKFDLQAFPIVDIVRDRK